MNELTTMLQIDATKIIEGSPESHKAILANDDDGNLLLIYGFGTSSAVVHQINREDLFKLMAIDRIDPGGDYYCVVKDLYKP